MLLLSRFSSTLFLLLTSSLLFANTISRFHQAPESAVQLKNIFQSKDRQALKAGAALYSNHCSACHGKDANGTANIPALSHGPTQSASNGELFWFIAKGSPENGMPPSGLSKKERWQLVTFLKFVGRFPEQAQAYFSGVSPTNLSLPSQEVRTPAPPPPFTDFRYEKPGQWHKITASDLPEPAPSESVGNAPEVVPRPENAWPKVPKGFKVQLYASQLDNPRLIRTAPNGDLFLAESGSGKIRVFRGITKEGKPKSSSVFVTGMNRPYGIAFYPPGKSPQWVFIGNTDAVVRIPYRSGDLKARGPAEHIADLPDGPKGHWTRDIQFSLDGKTLFVGVGSVSNVDDPDVTQAEKNRADIFAMNPDGTGVRIYASGIRNAGGGLAIQPGTGTLWASVNERDGLGDNLVPDYITHIQEGGFYGWPWFYIGGYQDPRYPGKHPELKNKLITPDVLLQPHHASLEMTFYDGTQFPPEYRGDIFAAQHGSWNRSVRTGYELIRIPLHHKGVATGEYEDFMTGFVIDNERVWGRPVGVAVAKDGSLFVSDDGSNSIWRIQYVGKEK